MGGVSAQVKAYSLLFSIVLSASAAAYAFSPRPAVESEAPYPHEAGVSVSAAPGQYPSEEAHHELFSRIDSALGALLPDDNLLAAENVREHARAAEEFARMTEKEKAEAFLSWYSGTEEPIERDEALIFRVVKCQVDGAEALYAWGSDSRYPSSFASVYTTRRAAPIVDYPGGETAVSCDAAGIAGLSSRIEKARMDGKNGETIAELYLQEVLGDFSRERLGREPSAEDLGFYPEEAVLKCDDGYYGMAYFIFPLEAGAQALGPILLDAEKQGFNCTLKPLAYGRSQYDDSDLRPEAGGETHNFTYAMIFPYDLLEDTDTAAHEYAGHGTERVKESLAEDWAGLNGSIGGNYILRRLSRYADISKYVDPAYVASPRFDPNWVPDDMRRLYACAGGSLRETEGWLLSAADGKLKTALSACASNKGPR